MYMDDTNLQEQINRGQDRPVITNFRFTIEPIIDLETGENRDIEWVEWSKPGDRYNSTTKEKIVRVRGNPAKGRPPMLEWGVIQPHYDAWKQGKQLEQDGTPFSEWKGVDPRLVEVLRASQIYTVEAFASFPGHQVTGLKFPNISRWHELARKFAADRAGKDALHGELAKRDETIAELQAAVRALQNTAEPKRGPGRPARVREDEEAA